jgi:hypothetical protein
MEMSFLPYALLWRKAMNVRRRMEMEQLTDLLLRRLSYKGVSPDGVPWLVRDVLNAVGEVEETSVSMINRRLAILGWDKEILDEFTLALIMCLIEKNDERRVEHHL